MLVRLDMAPNATAGPDKSKNVRGQALPFRDAALCSPLLFAALTGRSGHGLARASRNPRWIAAYPLGLCSTWHTGRVLLIYDGECGFCVRSARWIAARLPAEARVEPWQSLELEELGLSRPDAAAAVWWIDDRGRGPRRSRGAEAIGRSLVVAGGAWRIIGRLIVHPPLCWLARPIYTLVAANRHRLGGPRADGP